MDSPNRRRRQRNAPKKSGLIEEVLKATDNINEVDKLIAALIELTKKAHADAKVLLAGKGVAAYDFTWIKFWMPRTAKRLHYRPYDVSVAREVMSSMGLAWPSQPREEIAHRAMADVLSGIEEAKNAYNAVQQ